MTYFVYILRGTKSGSYYKEMTQNVTNLLKEQNSGEMKYTKSHVPWELISVIEKSSKTEAIILEMKLKNHSRKAT